MEKKKAKILLLAIVLKDMFQIFEEIGICYLASYLRREGHEVLLLEKDEEDIDFDCIFKFKPKFIGVSIYDASKDAVFRIIEKIKSKMPDVVICLGGYTPTFNGVALMQENKHVDYVIKGEGENVFTQLIQKVLSNEKLDDVEGLIYRDGGQIVNNPPQGKLLDINTLPWPARDLLFQNQLDTAVMSTSRGCLGGCTFCVSKSFWKKWRGRSVSDVIDEIEYIVDKYKKKNFFFADCSFEDPGPPYNRLKEFTDAVIRRHLDISYIAYFRAEFHRFADHELMRTLKKSGLCGALIGIESADDNDLKLYNKIATSDDNFKIIRLFETYDINPTIGFMMFNPYSTFESLQNNIEYLYKLGFAYNLEYVISAYTIYSGNPINKKLVRDGLWEETRGLFYGYTIQNKKIMDFATYIFNFREKINEETAQSFSKMQSYFVPLGYWISIYSHNQEISNVLTQELEYFKDIKNRLNESIHQWFVELLSLAQKQWNYNDAEKITQNYLNHQYIKDIYYEFIKHKNILHTKMSRYGIDLTHAPFT